MAGLPSIHNPLANTTAPRGPSIQHNIGQLFGHALNALPGYSSLGANITNPYVNYQGIPNPGAPKVLGASTATAPAPVAQAQPDSGSYSGGGSTTSNIDPYTGLSYDTEESQVNSQIGDLGNQFNVGHQNILDAYNSSYNKLLGDKAVGQRNYDTSKAQTLQDYTSARGNNQAQVGQQANSLQRLLGAHGYHGSANQAAGYAAALQGAQVNNGLEKGFGRNQQALDTNWGDYQNQWNSSLGDLGHQRDDQFNGLQSKVDQTKQGLLGQLAQIAAARGGDTSGYTNQINQLGTDVTNLGREYATPVLQATPAVYKAPSLESYATHELAPAQVNQGGAASNVNPFLSVLLGQQDKKNLNGLAA